MSEIKAAVFTSIAHFSKILTGFLLIKIISVYLGPEGLGKLGHFMSFISIITLLSGGGILNGVVKYVSEFHNNPIKLIRFVSAASSYSLIAGFVLLIVGFLFAKPLSVLLFGTQEFAGLITVLAFVQVLFSFSNIVNAVANGLKFTHIFATIQIIGNASIIPVAWVLTYYYGFIGAATSLVLSLSFFSIPALFYYWKSAFKNRIIFSLKMSDYFYNLSGFSLMVLFSAITFPLVEMIIRAMIIKGSGYNTAGTWFAAVKLSSAYTGFFNAFLAFYFVPILSSEHSKNKISTIINHHLLIIGAVFIILATGIYVSRFYFIPLLFSQQFEALNDVIHYQLIGDFFKICSYVITIITVAKAKVMLYIFAELIQNALFLIISIAFYTSNQVIESIMSAYILTYVIYFFITVFSYTLYLKMKPIQYCNQ